MSFGEGGIPVRATISDMGPLLLARLLNLNDTQAGVLQLVFKIADDQGLLLLDLKDLRAMIQHVGENAKNFTTEYGNVSTASIGAIQRGLLTLEEQGGDQFFGEPMLDIHDLMKVDENGRGVINILSPPRSWCRRRPSTLPSCSGCFPNCSSSCRKPATSTSPSSSFFFDEAHLLFTDAPQALTDKVEQVVRLIRSKGVGVFFVTQNPLDVPEKILGQLGNRVQHALRAFTPRDQKAVQSAAQTMRANPKFDAAAVITELGVGEALVSFLDEKGRPNVVERSIIFPPASRLGPLTPTNARPSSRLRRCSPPTALRSTANRPTKSARQAGKRQPAPGAIPAPPAGKGGLECQRLGQPYRPAKPSQPPQTATQRPRQQPGGGILGSLGEMLGGSTGPRGGKREGVLEAAAKSAARGMAGTVGRGSGQTDPARGTGFDPRWQTVVFLRPGNHAHTDHPPKSASTVPTSAEYTGPNTGYRGHRHSTG
jgi:hypothetical protein